MTDINARRAAEKERRKDRQIERQAQTITRLNRKLLAANRLTQRQGDLLATYMAEYGELPMRRAKTGRRQ